MFEALQQHLRQTVKLPETEWAFAAPHLRQLRLRKHEAFVVPGQVCRHLAFVETGVLRSFLTTTEREVTNDFFLPGSFVSAFTSFITQVPSVWTVQALEACELVVFSQDFLQTLYARHSAWLYFNKGLMETEFIKKCRRESSFLRHAADQRYQALLQQYPTLEQHVPQYHIASYLGIQPETLSRLRARPTPSVPFS
ncbi:MAG: Crp/Fnr family transcriptional regulator [Janthinobacterium lividum]